jgi:hypothetical protein
MSTPSLLNIPHRLKAGKLYSQIPESGAGDFTVTRTTTPTAGQATRVNANGLIELVADNVPRLDYPLGGAVNGCPALLVEPSAINIAWPSEDFMTSWTLSGVTRTADQTASPNGLVTADRISITSNGGYIRRLLATSNSTTYTASCFVKNDTITGSDLFRFYFNNNLSGGNIAIAQAVININAGTVATTSSGGGISGVSTGIENYGNGWYRVRVTLTLGAAAGNASSEIGFDATTATRTFFAWGAQLEVGSVPTSYIPTTTAQRTRDADVISASGGVSGSIGQTEGSIYVEVDIQKLLGITQRTFIDIGQAGNRLFLGYGNGLTNQIRFLIQTSFVGVVDLRSVATTTGIIRIAVGYKDSDNAMYVNGVSASPFINGNFTATLTGLTQLSIGSSSNVGETHFLNDRIRAVALYPTRLPNTGPNSLQSLTQ